MQKLTIYSAENPTPRQLDAMQAIIDEYRAERGVQFTVQVWKPGMRDKTLVLGSQGPDQPGDYQFTYSSKQIESRANTKTVLFAALDSYFGVTKGLSDYVLVRVYNTAQFTSLFFEDYFDVTKPMAIDVETGGVLGENVTPRTAPMLTIAFAQGERAVTMIIDDPALGEGGDDNKNRNIEWLQAILPCIEKPIFHNGKFDITVIEGNTGIRMPNWFDTMLAHHVLNHAAREHGLKILCKRYFDAEDWEAEIKTWIKGKQKDYSAIPRGFLGKYNAYDVLWTYRLWEMLSIQIEADDRAQMAFYLEMQAAEFLADVEKVGIPVSERQVHRLTEEYQRNASLHKQVLCALVGNDNFNPGSPKQVKEALQKNANIWTDSTDEEHIDQLLETAEDGDWLSQFCTQLIGYRKNTKMVSTYTRPWLMASTIEGDNRAHPTFNVHGTTTGRLSSSNPNAQNVPRDKTIRKMVTLDGSNERV